MEVLVSRNYTFMALCLIVLAGFVYLSAMSMRADSFEESFGARRARVLGELTLAIDDAVLLGKYECCIDPPCTMCYMGSWVWNDGTCLCDDMIAKGEFDKVCPQCLRGIEEGYCKSTAKSSCEINA